MGEGEQHSVSGSCQPPVVETPAALQTLCFPSFVAKSCCSAGHLFTQRKNYISQPALQRGAGISLEPRCAQRVGAAVHHFFPLNPQEVKVGAGPRRASGGLGNGTGRWWSDFTQSFRALVFIAGRQLQSFLLV